MSGSLNEATLIGNVGADPECKRTQDGRLVVNIRLATSETWRDKATGERKEKTEWHRVTIWNEGLCKVAEQYVKKGAKILVRGQLQTRKWTDQAGVEKYSTEVVLNGYGGVLTMLDKPPSKDEEEPTPMSLRLSKPNSYAEAHGRSTRDQGSLPRHDMDDDIPFSPEWR